MATEYGFVYVLANESMPGIYKIGFTLGHPKARMDQLSSATACPTPFEMIACFGVADPRGVESDIHQRLKRYRVNTAREFFRVHPSVLQSEIRRHADEENDLVNIYGLDDKCNEQYCEDMERERLQKIERFVEQCADPIHWPTKFDNPFLEDWGASNG